MKFILSTAWKVKIHRRKRSKKFKELLQLEIKWFSFEEMGRLYDDYTQSVKLHRNKWNLKSRKDVQRLETMWTCSDGVILATMNSETKIRKEEKWTAADEQICECRITVGRRMKLSQWKKPMKRAKAAKINFRILDSWRK